MSIIVKKDKKKISYFVYISLLAFVLAVVWFFYSKWLAEQRVSKEKKSRATIDVTEGLADIKIDESKKVLESKKYINLSPEAPFEKFFQKGKANLFK